MNSMNSIKTKRPVILNAAVICLCFLLTSTAYLAWAYNIMELVRPETADAICMGAGYLAQAAGIGLFVIVLRRGGRHKERLLYAAAAVHMLCLVPSVLASSLMAAVLFGMLLNLMCGMIAGYYLYRLTCETEAAKSAVTLGAGYGLSIVASWALSLIGDGAIYNSYPVLVFCLILSVIIFAVCIKDPASETGYENELDAVLPQAKIPQEGQETGRFFLLAGGLVLLFSIVNSCGFGFPSSDIQSGVSLEFSRLFYAAGLVIAGLVSGRNRKYGAVCALTALVIPFLMITLSGEPVPQMIFWALSYFTFGFYTVFRIILFSDIAKGAKLFYLACFGLLAGRIGDAAGELLCLALSRHIIVLIVITAVLFMAAIVLFLKLYQRLYLPEPVIQRSERDTFNRFAARYDLSAREREVLRFLLEERTNAEIAEMLSISEGTVKYHIHNLLQKTSCRNRIALLAAYSASED